MEEQKQDKKKYWIKLDKDFLKSPQMKVIRNMKNGKDYIIFYLSLMLESVETVGHLRFTSLVPYDAEMLSAITDTDIDIVRSATKLFCELGMMQIFDDGTIFMTEVPNITGKECESAERVRKYRLKQQEQKMLLRNESVTLCNDKSNDNKEIYIEKDKNKNKYIYIDLFEQFWEHYPKKKDKGNAEKWFKKNKPDKELVDLMIKQIERLKDTNDWKKQDGQFIPYPTTWLNAKGWEDEFETDTEKEKRIEREIMEGTYGT